MNIVFMVFNRPEHTARVFKRIAEARPEKLLLVADGPRASHADDIRKVQEVREIISQVDWPCEVFRNISDINLGCKNRVASGLDWAFSLVEDAIIIEDDCLPDSSFFLFCRELLTHYKNDERVMHIGGNNFLRGKMTFQSSYYFSKYTHIWGWATWRRAWKHYDVSMKTWPALRDNGWLGRICPNKREQQYWSGVFNKVFRGEIDTWDYQWSFACWTQGGVSVVPRTSLVENIGFGPGATHTDEAWSPNARDVVGSFSGALIHPTEVRGNEKADRYTYEAWYAPPGKMSQTVFNRYWYGKALRKIPVFGALWARWRMQRLSPLPS